MQRRASSPPRQIRSPADDTLRDLPTDLYCKTAQNDPTVVRGARNYPCQEFPGKRAPTVQLCRDPEGYVPIGSNPWRGPPIPYGTPIQDGRNILPPNKFPFIPPGADYDPGPPAVQLPPGVGAGSGACAERAVPAAGAAERQRPPPPPWPYYAPPDQIVPPYGRPAPAGAEPLPPPGPAAADAPPAGRRAPLPARPRPQAGGVSYGTYDQDGKFVDPAGGTGVFAGGADKLAPAENWVDLMMDPRQA